MKFREIFNPKYIIFAVAIFAIMLTFAYCQSIDMVKVTFEDNQINTTCEAYTIKIRYDEIESVELVALPEEPGEKIEGFDDGTVLYGAWKNDLWGEYYACVDPDTNQCIVIQVKEGDTYVISRKDDTETESIYNELTSRLP